MAIEDSKVKAIGFEFLKLAEKRGWSTEAVYITCRELARFLESEGIRLVEGMPGNPLN